MDGLAEVRFIACWCYFAYCAQAFVKFLFK